MTFSYPTSVCIQTVTFRTSYLFFAVFMSLKLVIIEIILTYRLEINKKSDFNAPFLLRYRLEEVYYNYFKKYVNLLFLISLGKNRQRDFSAQ